MTSNDHRRSNLINIINLNNLNQYNQSDQSTNALAMNRLKNLNCITAVS